MDMVWLGSRDSSSEVRALQRIFSPLVSTRGYFNAGRRELGYEGHAACGERAGVRLESQILLRLKRSCTRWSVAAFARRLAKLRGRRECADGQSQQARNTCTLKRR